MAYAYDRILNALGRGNQNQSNIFGGGQQAQPQGSQQDVGSEPSVASSGGSEEIGGGSGSGVSGSTQNPMQGSRVALERNQGKQTSGMDLGGISGRINQAKQDIQSQADDYVTKAGSQYGLQGGALSEAQKKEYQNYIQGSGGGETVQRFQGAPLTPESPFQYNAPSFQDVELLRTQGGIRDYMQRQGGPRASAGEAAFDANLLARDKAFQKQRMDTLQNLAGLRDVEQSVMGSVGSRAQEAANKAYDAFRGASTGYLEGEAQALDAAAQARDAQYDAMRRNTQAQDIMPEFQSFLDSLRGENQELAPYLGDVGAVGDVMSYYNPSMTAEQTSLGDFYTADEAARFGRIMELLGRGDARNQGQFAGANMDDITKGTIDFARFREDALNKAMANKSIADQAAAERAIAEEQARQAEAQRKADEEEARRRFEQISTPTPGQIQVAPIDPFIIANTPARQLTPAQIEQQRRMREAEQNRVTTPGQINFGFGGF